MKYAIRQKIKDVDTPFYIYDEDQIVNNIGLLKNVFSECNARIFYAVKANDAVAILKTICSQGIGAEAVSPGEIYLARKAGFKPGMIIYNNVARKRDEIEYAISKGIRYFNFEAIDQAHLLEQGARRCKKRINLFVRINPGIHPKTHSHLSTGAPLSKFGVEGKQLNEVAKFARKAKYARLVGIHSHIGSQILTPEPFITAAKNGARVLEYFAKKGIKLECVNLGGGFGIPYRPGERALDFGPIVAEYQHLSRSTGVPLLLEPGRFIVGNSGSIVTRVISQKKRDGKALCIVDADMTENPRPAIYRAYHHIEPLIKRKSRRQKTRIAGPLCENANEFGTYLLPRLSIGDYLIIRNSGAYTRTMSSNYNGRLRSAEYSVKRGTIRRIRRKQRLENLMENERY